MFTGATNTYTAARFLLRDSCSCRRAGLFRIRKSYLIITRDAHLCTSISLSYDARACPHRNTGCASRFMLQSFLSLCFGDIAICEGANDTKGPIMCFFFSIKEISVRPEGKRTSSSCTVQLVSLVHKLFTVGLKDRTISHAPERAEQQLFFFFQERRTYKKQHESEGGWEKN